MWTGIAFIGAFIAVIYVSGAIGTFVYNGLNSYGPLRWSKMVRSALLWPAALPALINANREP